MDVRDFVRQFNKTPEEIKKRYPEDYTTFWNEEKTWLGNLDNKLHLLKGGFCRINLVKKVMV
jgi:hypothetical protein